MATTQTASKPASKPVAKAPGKSVAVINQASAAFVRKFRYGKSTPGAQIYVETDAKGGVLKTSMPGCLIGSLYFRKTALQSIHLNAESPPVTLHVSINIGDNLSPATKGDVARVFRLDHSTPGAQIYVETDAKGGVLKTNNPECFIGSLYLRKTALQASKLNPEAPPPLITLTASFA